MSACLVRPATDHDAASAVEVLRASIIQLCIADHQNDPAILEGWLQNKTTAHFRFWLGDPESFIVVAELDSILCGVGAVRKSGDLDLLYVQPGRERRGVGRAILYSLEDQARRWNLPQIQLISTLTARSFYERHGYVLEEQVPQKNGEIDYRYSMRLG